MAGLLIPFGIHRETGEIIEPEDAERGRRCNCLCPGCKAPLLSRHTQLEDRRQHFAHDSKHELARPEEDCPFSSSVAVAMMIRDLVGRYYGKSFVTPESREKVKFSCCEGGDQDITISSGREVVIQRAEANVDHFDVRLIIYGYPLLIDLVYKGKSFSEIDEGFCQNLNAGVIAINCDQFHFDSWKKQRGKKFSEAVLEFFLEGESREWRYHPRRKRLIDQVKHAHSCMRNSISLGRSVPSRSSLRFNSEKGSHYCAVCASYSTPLDKREPYCPECGGAVYKSQIR